MSTSGGVTAGVAPPGYGQASGLSYLPSRNVANFQASNAAKIRAAIQRAAAGGSGEFAFVGDSFQASFNGNGLTLDTEQGFPAQLLKFLVASGTGVVHGGTGVRPGTAASGVANTGYTFTGGFDITTLPFAFTFSGGTVTYVSPQAGTIVRVCYWGQNSNFSFTVDGGAVNNVVPSGLAQWETFALPGQANAVHTVLITCGATYLHSAVSVNQATGLRCHNLGYGGALINSGTSQFNWSDTSGTTNLGLSRLAALPAALDAVFIQLGTNDLAQGVSADVAAQGYAKILARAPLVGVPPVLVVAWRNAAFNTEAQWDVYLSKCYAIAAQLGCFLIDWNDRVQGQAGALAAGLLGPDNLHPAWSTQSGFGKSIGDLLLD